MIAQVALLGVIVATSYNTVSRCHNGRAEIQEDRVPDADRIS